MFQKHQTRRVAPAGLGKRKDLRVNAEHNVPNRHSKSIDAVTNRPEVTIYASALLIERLARSRNGNPAEYRRLARLAKSLKSVAASMVLPAAAGAHA